MAYDTNLADRIREYLLAFSNLDIEEKEMFRGLTFMINGKMCISVSGQNLMCRYDPVLHEEIAERKGYQPMVMKNKELKGYCYIDPIGSRSKNELKYWLDLCLAFNDRAKASKKKKETK